MFDNVLIGIDGRTGGRDAIGLASRLADGEAELALVHVDTGAVLPSHAISPGLGNAALAASEMLLARERSAAGVDAQVIAVEAGSPGAGLHEQAERQRADLLVVGSCRRWALGRAMLDDDTRAALNGAPCAVAVAPVGGAADARPINRIGVAYNGSPEAAGALAVARELAARTGAAIDALEVVSIPTVAYTGIIATDIGESIEALLREAVGRMKGLPGVEGRAVYGLPGEELASFSSEVDLLVVGSRGYGPVKRLVLGSTSNYLARHARCALLVLPRLVTLHEERGAPSGELVASRH